MFNSNDKLTITLINARDINGNILPFQLKLPLKRNQKTHISEQNTIHKQPHCTRHI